MITVYHGSTEAVESPICAFGRPRLDFGQGFYVTQIREQAVKWAKTIAERRGKYPLINTYSLDREQFLTNGRYRIFSAYDAEWLNFIASNRRGENLYQDYDYIEGGIANDRVIDTVNLYVTGLIDSATALQQLAYQTPNNQICLLNQDMTDKYLKYYGTERI